MPNTQVFREIEPWKKPYHAAFAYLAKVYLKLLPNLKVIAITGSVGKTLTHNTVYSVLSQKYKVVVGDENLDPTFRIPKTILKARPWHNYLILEYGVEHPGDMDYYLSIAKPDIAIVTRIGKTHTKYFRNIEGVFTEKSKLIKELKKNDTAILNARDDYAQRIAQLTAAKILWVGKPTKNSLIIFNFKQDLNGSSYRLRYNQQATTVRSKIIGKHHLLSAQIAAELGISNNLTLTQIAKGLSQTKAPTHRLNLIRTGNFNIIDDTYNSSPLAAQEALSTLLDLGKDLGKFIVLGEMRDLGSISKTAHTELGQKIAKTGISYLITVGKVAKVASDSAKENGFKGKIINCSTTREAVQLIADKMPKNHLILIKGSRHEHLERIVLGICGRSTQINCYHCGSLS